MLRTGCQWRYLPGDFPPYSTVHSCYRRWRLDGTLERLHDFLRRDVRQAAGRDPEPSIAIVDSQSVKTTEKRGIRGFDAGKKVKGCKRHLVVDTMGMVMACFVSAASMRDEWGAVWALDPLKGQLPRLRLLRADARYPGALASWVGRILGCDVEIVHRPKEQKGFVVLKGRWVVERTFGGLGRSRRLSKDYEGTPASSRAMILWAMTHLMIKRLHPQV